MVELESGGVRRYTLKLSADKATLPGIKQIFRYADHDLLARSKECPSCPPGSAPAEALLRPVVLGGYLVEPLPSAAEARAHAAECLARLPAPCHSLFEGEPCWRVDISAELECLAARVRTGVAQ
jgi:nicotinate phosphoribosyltransferase